jgi:hypothetical protein
MRDGMKHLHRDVDTLTEHFLELRRTEDVATERSRGAHRGGAWTVVEKCYLAEEVTRGKGVLPLRRIHLGLPREDDEKVAGSAASPADRLASGNIHFLDTHCDEAQLLIVASREERDGAKPLDAHVHPRVSLGARANSIEFAQRAVCPPGHVRLGDSWQSPPVSW